jgi:hypothetical protein
MTPWFLKITKTKIARQSVVSLMKRGDLPTAIISLGIQLFAPIPSLYRVTPRRPPGRRLKRRAYPGMIAILSGRPKGFGIVWSRPQQKPDPSGLRNCDLPSRMVTAMGVKMNHGKNWHGQHSTCTSEAFSKFGVERSLIMNMMGTKMTDGTNWPRRHSTRSSEDLNEYLQWEQAKSHREAMC